MYNNNTTKHVPMRLVVCCKTVLPEFQFSSSIKKLLKHWSLNSFLSHYEINHALLKNPITNSTWKISSTRQINLRLIRNFRYYIIFFGFCQAIIRNFSRNFLQSKSATSLTKAKDDIIQRLTKKLKNHIE